MTHTPTQLLTFRLVAAQTSFLSSSSPRVRTPTRPKLSATLRQVRPPTTPGNYKKMGTDCWRRLLCKKRIDEQKCGRGECTEGRKPRGLELYLDMEGRPRQIIRIRSARVVAGSSPLLPTSNQSRPLAGATVLGKTLSRCGIHDAL